MSEKTNPNPADLRGLQKICRLYGSIKCGGTRIVWDYANEEAVKESEMTKERLAASEKAKWEMVKDVLPVIRLSVRDERI